MHKSKSDLAEELENLKVHQSQIERLVDLFNDENQEFEMSAYQHKATINTFERAHDVISIRMQTIESALVEFDPDPRNEAHYFGFKDMHD